MTELTGFAAETTQERVPVELDADITAHSDDDGSGSSADGGADYHPDDELIDDIVEPSGEPEITPVPDWARSAEPEDLAPALEALCFALNRALTLSEAAAILGRTAAHVGAAADILSAQLRGRGMMLQRHNDEIQLVTRPEVAWAVQRALNPEKPGRLSRPALETLAIVAYRQPATRAAIEAIRGVNCEAVLDSLERRALINEVGRAETPGHPRLFGTTLRFLQMVGLERIEDLPAMPADLLVPVLDEDFSDNDLDRVTDENIDPDVIDGEAQSTDGPGVDADDVLLDSGAALSGEAAVVADASDAGSEGASVRDTAGA